MQIKTKGIVLSHIKYKDSSIIVRIYTQAKGLQSYIVNGVRSKSQAKKSKIALYQPLTILDLVVYHRNDRSIHRIAEAKGTAPYFSIPFEFRKTSIGIFIAELLTKSVREEEENQGLYDFIETSLLTLDNMSEQYENFHLQFFLKLTRFLGFLSTTVDEMQVQFFEAANNRRLNTSGLQLQEELEYLIREDYLSYIALNRKKRQAILEVILRYYSLHIENLGEIKSLKVLSEVMS